VRYSILLGKKRINFYKGSGIYDGSCVKMVSQYHLTLPGDYVLPVTVVKEEPLLAILIATNTRYTSFWWQSSMQLLKKQKIKNVLSGITKLKIIVKGGKYNGFE
jgi:hypothetical protein